MRIETFLAVDFPPLEVVKPSLFSVLAISLRLLVSLTRTFSIATACLLLALLAAFSCFVLIAGDAKEKRKIIFSYSQKFNLDIKTEIVK